MSIWPAIILIIGRATVFGVHCANHGQDTGRKFNCVNSLINTAVLFSILWWGGFFDALLNAVGGAK